MALKPFEHSVHQKFALSNIRRKGKELVVESYGSVDNIVVF